MLLSQAIEFPNLGIRIDELGKSFSVFGISIAYYGVIIGLGIVAGFLVARWQAIRTGQDQEMYLDLALFVVPVSIIGARIYYVLFSWGEFRENPMEILNLRSGGLAIYGGIIAAVITVFFFSRFRKKRFWLIADTCCPGLVLGQVIGRWGNFFNREAFGGYTDSLFAMRLSVLDVDPSSITETMLVRAQEDGYSGFIQVHPTFLYESVWNIGLLVLLLVCTRHKKFDGELFLIYLFGYGIGRFWIEGLRTDQLYLWGSELAVSQAFSLLLVVFSLVLWIAMRTAKLHAKKTR